jgi:hypothetical protein
MARKIATEGALCSPYALTRLSRSLLRLPDDIEGIETANGAMFLCEVAHTLFNSRNPAGDYVVLRSQESVGKGNGVTLFDLCSRAIMRSVFRHDWEASERFFQRALEMASRFGDPVVEEAVIGLAERYLLLPRDGGGVRSHSSSGDVLFAINRAEQLFCQGETDDALRTVKTLLAKHPELGWARLLLVRILFADSEFEAARAALSESGLGSVPAGEELAWDTILAGALTSQGNAYAGISLARVGQQQFRLPLYFEGLAAILRGDVSAGVGILETAKRVGEPAALMLAHDPVIQTAIRVGAAPRQQQRVTAS